MTLQLINSTKNGMTKWIGVGKKYELRGKLQDILIAIKAIVSARKKGRNRTADADGMGGE